MAAAKQKYKKMDMQTSMKLRILHQECRLSAYKLVKRYRKLYAERTIYRHAKKPVDEVTPFDRRTQNKGRPRKLSMRMERIIIRTIARIRRDRTEFSSKKIQEVAGLGWDVTSRDIRRCLNKHGYKYCQSRKKGLLSDKDKTIRTKYAREHLKLSPEFWTSDLGFYLDGVGFAFKPNPAGEARIVSSMTWRRPNEGVAITTKGRKEGSGGKMANFFVGISYRTGVVMCHHHDWKITGANFATHIVNEQFPAAFQKSGSAPPHRFLQDGCPKQNAKVSREAWERKNYIMVKIPARSPDLNPIENFFHLVRKKLKADAIEQNITKEKYTEFVQRISKTMSEGIPIETINNLISSMPKRLALVVKNKGLRTKY